MARQTTKRSSRPRKPEPQLVISDSWADRAWKWGGRVIVIVGFVGGGMWWLFGWYNGVEGVKATVSTLTTSVSALVQRVETLQNGQKETHEVLQAIQKTINAAPPQATGSTRR